MTDYLLTFAGHSRVASGQPHIASHADAHVKRYLGREPDPKKDDKLVGARNDIRHTVANNYDTYCSQGSI